MPEIAIAAAKNLRSGQLCRDTGGGDTPLIPYSAENSKCRGEILSFRTALPRHRQRGHRAGDTPYIKHTVQNIRAGNIRKASLHTTVRLIQAYRYENSAPHFVKR